MKFRETSQQCPWREDFTSNICFVLGMVGSNLGAVSFEILNEIAFADSSFPVIASSDLQDTSASAVMANAVADFKLKGDGSAHNSGETGVSGLDEEPTSPQSKGSINEARRLSDDTVKRNGVIIWKEASIAYRGMFCCFSSLKGKCKLWKQILSVFLLTASG